PPPPFVAEKNVSAQARTVRLPGGGFSGFGFDSALEFAIRGNGGNGLQNAAGNLVRIALRIGTAVFEVAAVFVVHEAVRDAHRSAAVRDAVVELVNRLRFVEAGEAEMIVRAIH